MTIFIKQGKNFCLSLYYNQSSSFLFVNGVKIYQFKTKDSELNAYPLYIGNVSKVFSNGNMKQTGLNGYVYNFSVDFGTIDVADILDIHTFLMKKTWCEIMFGFNKKTFIGLSSACTIGSLCESLAFDSIGPIKCVTLNNQPCQARPTVADINSNTTLLYTYTVSVKNFDVSYCCWSKFSSLYSK